MDIAKPKSNFRFKYPRLTVVVAVLLAMLLVGFAAQPSGQVKLSRSNLLVGAVQRGELQVTVDGYGILRSQKQTLLTALTAATVAEVVLRPGAAVEEGSIILRLNNPELIQEVELANNTLLQEQANLRRLSLTNQRDILTEQAALAELTADLQAISLRKEAEEGLAQKGIIPQITFKTTLLQQHQIQQRVQFQEQRIVQLKQVVKEAQLIQQKQIAQADAHYQNMQQRVDRLTVRAGLKGVLQRLPVELGQSVTAGQELALVGSDKDLLALIRVSQSKAEQLQVGQPAQINTRREKVAGVVTRITPEVRDGTIEVEVAFSEGVPASARPELNVDAQIFTKTISNTLFIERPMNAQSHTKISLFKLSADAKQAALHTLNLGEDSGKYMQIEQGANETERYILSDMNTVHDAKTIQLVD